MIYYLFLILLFNGCEYTPTKVEHYNTSYTMHCLTLINDDVWCCAKAPTDNFPRCGKWYKRLRPVKGAR